MANYTTTGVTASTAVRYVIVMQDPEPASRAKNFQVDTPTFPASTAMVQHELIANDPKILNGQPYIRGTRIPVSAILDGLGEGLTYEDLVEHYPRLTPEGFRAVKEYSSALLLRPKDQVAHET